MDSYTQLFSPKLLDSNILFLGVSIFVTASSVYNFYLLNKMFQSQQETLRENQQHQYQIYQDLLAMISDSHSFRDHTIISSSKKPETLALLPEEKKEFVFEKDMPKEKNKSESNLNDTSFKQKDGGFLNELKEVLKKRETS